MLWYYIWASSVRLVKKECGCGEIGRRTRLRIWRLRRGGSSPFTRTILDWNELLKPLNKGFESFFIFLGSSAFEMLFLVENASILKNVHYFCSGCPPNVHQRHENEAIFCLFFKIFKKIFMLIKFVKNPHKMGIFCTYATFFLLLTGAFFCFF